MSPDLGRMSTEVSARIDDCLGYGSHIVRMVRPAGQDLLYTLWFRETHQWIVRGILPAHSIRRECVQFADKLINTMANMRHFYGHPT